VLSKQWSVKGCHGSSYSAHTLAADSRRALVVGARLAGLEGLARTTLGRREARARGRTWGIKPKNRMTSLRGHSVAESRFDEEAMNGRKMIQPYGGRRFQTRQSAWTFSKKETSDGLLNSMEMTSG
jgi:hypothetical protein